MKKKLYIVFSTIFVIALTVAVALAVYNKSRPILFSENEISHAEQLVSSAFFTGISSISDDSFLDKYNLSTSGKSIIISVKTEEYFTPHSKLIFSLTNSELSFKEDCSGSIGKRIYLIFSLTLIAFLISIAIVLSIPDSIEKGYWARKSRRKFEKSIYDSLN